MVTLTVNYRSRGPLARLCAGVASAMESDGEAAHWEAARGEPGGPAAPIILATARDGEAELDGIAASIHTSMAQGIRARDHAVLCATNAQATSVSAGLRRRGAARAGPSGRGRRGGRCPTASDRPDRRLW